MSRAFSHTIKQVLLIGAILIALLVILCLREEIVLIVMEKNTDAWKKIRSFFGVNRWFRAVSPGPFYFYKRKEVYKGKKKIIYHKR